MYFTAFKDGILYDWPLAIYLKLKKKFRYGITNKFKARGHRGRIK